MALTVIDASDRAVPPAALASLTSILGDIDNGLVAPERPDLASSVNWGGGADLPIHRWFRYREGFSPNLIGRLDLGARILDPFCGCGSIMVGAAQQSRSSVGIDVNPLAAFVAKVKLSPLALRDIETVERFLDGFEVKLDKIHPWHVPALRIARKVFEPDVLDTVLRLRALIEMQESSKPVRDFLLLCWLTILQDVGSYFKEGNGIKYRNRKRLKTGYVQRPNGEWQLQRFGADQSGFVKATYKRKLREMMTDVSIWQLGTWSDQTVIHGNALEEAQQLEEESFDSVIFSPPYANRFDYFESMKVELWFGGFVESYQDMIDLRKRSLRSHLGAALDNKPSALPEIEALIGLIDPNSYAVRMRVPALIRGYFDDLARILQRCRTLLKPGGMCHVVVGNSAYGGVIIPTDSLTARLGLDAGFDNAAVVPVRHLTVAPQQRNELRGRVAYMRESIVTFK
jgi:site-specific DNA-methyltransferase (adenine-specific)